MYCVFLCWYWHWYWYWYWYVLMLVLASQQRGRTFHPSKSQRGEDEDEDDDEDEDEDGKGIIRSHLRLKFASLRVVGTRVPSPCHTIHMMPPFAPKEGARWAFVVEQRIQVLEAQVQELSRVNMEREQGREALEAQPAQPRLEGLARAEPSVKNVKKKSDGKNVQQWVKNRGSWNEARKKAKVELLRRLMVHNAQCSIADTVDVKAGKCKKGTQYYELTKEFFRDGARDEYVVQQ